MSNDIKAMRIKSILENNIIKMYIDNPLEMRRSLKNLYLELSKMSNIEVVEMYDYLLTDTTKNGEFFHYIAYGKTYIICVSIYENNKCLDMRNKKVKSYNREDFKYNKNTKQFEKIIIF
jgi:hypothetical protein